MRREIEEREPERDPELGAALLDVYAASPVAADRADLLRRRIRDRAAALSRGGTGSPLGVTASSEMSFPAAAGRVRRSYLARPHRRVWAVPVLLAAMVAGVLLVAPRLRETSSTGAQPAVQAVGFASAEQALATDMSDAEFARAVTREDDPAALLAIAVAATP